MKNGQVAQLQELSKCYMYWSAAEWVRQMLTIHKWDRDGELPKGSKAYLRRLTHQYRGQIAAMKRNRGKA
jgi:hypothetical protein